MKQRIITGIVLVLVVFSFLLYSTEYLFSLGVFFIATIAAYEWIKLAKVEENKVIKYIALFAVSILVVAALFKYLLFIFPLFWIYAIYNLYRYEKNKLETLSQRNIILMGIFSISPFCTSLDVLYSNNLYWIFIFILVIAASDSGAYFTGKAIGKRKMLPRLSPNKTIEGLIGGLISSAIVAAILLAFMHLSFGIYILMLIIFVITALVSVIGDVFESMIKRISGVKDSGNILPGHGGILDRIDSYLPSLQLFVLLGYIVGVFVV